MRSRSAVFMLALAISVTGCAPTDGDGSAAMTDADRASIQQQLFQMGNDWSEAYETGDLSAFDRIFADDFIYTVTDGTLYEKAAFISFAEQDPIDYDSVRVGDKGLRWYGTTAVVTGLVVSYWTEDGAVQSGARQFTNVFVERAGRWQVVVGHSSPVH